jgi:hypothetical protein
MLDVGDLAGRRLTVLARHWATWPVGGVDDGYTQLWSECHASCLDPCPAAAARRSSGQQGRGRPEYVAVVHASARYGRRVGTPMPRRLPSQAEAESPQVVQVMSAASADGGCRIIRCSAPVSISSISQMSPCLSACRENR